MSTKYIYKNKEYVQKYDNKKYGGNFGEYLKNKEINTFMSMIDSDCERILDIGSGTGKLSIFMNHTSNQVVSLDNSHQMLKFAKNKANKAGTVYLPVVCDAYFICFGDRVFDCVVASRVLMHFSDWEKALSEICRVSDKVVIFDFMVLLSFAGIDSFFKKFKKLMVRSTETYRTFLIRNVVSELKKNNFKVVQKRKRYFLPHALHRLINNPSLSERIEEIFMHTGIINQFGSPATIKAVRIDLES